MADEVPHDRRLLDDNPPGTENEQFDSGKHKNF